MGAAGDCKDYTDAQLLMDAYTTSVKEKSKGGGDQRGEVVATVASGCADQSTNFLRAIRARRSRSVKRGSSGLRRNRDCTAPIVSCERASAVRRPS